MIALPPPLGAIGGSASSTRAIADQDGSTSGGQEKLRKDERYKNGSNSTTETLLYPPIDESEEELVLLEVPEFNETEFRADSLRLDLEKNLLHFDDRISLDAVETVSPYSLLCFGTQGFDLSSRPENRWSNLQTRTGTHDIWAREPPASSSSGATAASANNTTNDTSAGAGSSSSSCKPAEAGRAAAPIALGPGPPSGRGGAGAAEPGPKVDPPTGNTGEGGDPQAPPSTGKTNFVGIVRRIIKARTMRYNPDKDVLVKDGF
ncbi:unnamed protein product [Amoebophrya sp. A25]|nr:unnamed protein product [Amoebophrya sp. A25]|eukprot:GSA25T00007900001.1